MKTLFVVALSLLAAVVVAGIIVYVVGSRLPVNHSTTVTGTVEASPQKTFAIITGVAEGAAWRKQVKSVKVLPPDEGRDHWVEDLGRGQTMTFLATATNAPEADGYGQREVLLDVPGATYGGTWTYKLMPGPTPNQTVLQITEDGFINPPIYRFVMQHVMGMAANLDQYMKDIQARARAS